MLILRKCVISILFLSIFENNLYSDTLPIIVIAPGKTPQAKSTVGSDISVIEEKDLLENNNYFIGEIIDDNLPGVSFFQQGGVGTVSSIQLRGLPGRYSTIYG